jgi:chromosome partitioning protein
LRAANPDLIAYAFLNRADPRGQDNEDSAAALQETAELRFLDTPLGARKAFSNAAAQGMAVTELKPPDPKATDEMMMLYGYLFDTSVASTQAVGA